MSELMRRELPPDTTIVVDGTSVPARTGEMLAAALLVEKGWGSLYCGMGACHACRVFLDARREVLACLTPVRPGMTVSTFRPRFDDRD